MRVRTLANSLEVVKGVEKGYVKKMRFNYFVDIHIKVDGKIRVDEGHRIARLVKDKSYRRLSAG